LSVLRGPHLAIQEESVVDLFKRQAMARPTAIAVSGEAGSLTYADLDEQATAVSASLASMGLGEGASVMLCMYTAPQAIVGLLGILMSGATALLADPTHPRDRIAFLMRDCCVRAALVDPGLDLGTAGRLVGDTVVVEVSDTVECTRPSARAPRSAYVISTSGSTGVPKGVEVCHDALSHSTQARFAYYSTPVSAFLLLSPLSFDSSLAGVFWTLCQGGTLLVPGRLDPFELERPRERPTYALCTPSFYDTFLSEITQRRGAHWPLPPEYMIVAGEACQQSLVAKHRAVVPKTPLFNEYGPTEACVWATVANLSNEPPDDQPSIGTPIANTTVLLCDGNGAIVDRGEVGEICIAGPGLAAGYVGNADLTRDRFVPSPLPGGQRMYRTGDRARVGLHGLHYLGRDDGQVKIRGIRVEVGEIEHRLREIRGVDRGAVVVAEVNGQSALVAFATPKATLPPAAELRSALARHVPEFMIPACVEAIDELPTTPSGKLDRHALIDLAATLLARQSNPVNRCEQQENDPVLTEVIRICEELLSVGGICGDDNFFDLGGQSLLAARLVARLQRELGTRIGVRDVFDADDLAGLTRTITVGRMALPA
jgi:amino acid adenylation domain-containing protein